MMHEEDRMNKQARQDLLPELEQGQVWLVGAGPGDPGLLTLHAVRALEQADVIVYDALVDETCLQFANKNAVLEYAGKRGGKPSPKQRDISLRLVELAQQNKRVLRLKGGDPFVFGRGAEEALTLVEYGIKFRIVPGVTAGIGGLAYAGIPATHRTINQSVTFLTGHDANGVMPDKIDWSSIACGSPVIVMYMAMKHIGEITRRLMDAGRAADEAVAFVCNASLASQHVLETTLEKAETAVREAGLQPPAIVVVGEVVKMRQSLDWLSAAKGRNWNSDIRPRNVGQGEIA
jgi:uroporphyrin-III C-methyltransferase